jgi:hypothetical protein
MHHHQEVLAPMGLMLEDFLFQGNNNNPLHRALIPSEQHHLRLTTRVSYLSGFGLGSTQ